MEAIFDYYESKKLNLGSRFIQNTIKKIELISGKPDRFSADANGIRKIRVSEFPYFIHYILEASIVIIIAIWHIARLPLKIVNRLS